MGRIMFLLVRGRGRRSKTLYKKYNAKKQTKGYALCYSEQWTGHFISGIIIRQEMPARFFLGDAFTGRPAECFPSHCIGWKVFLGNATII
ncbi:MAG: hypothetical protein D3917_02975 [Candidatus Electrothrix sp. AX5]|nr:hypothetical protein [Candidatus Electrothrix sp. AX5]